MMYIITSILKNLIQVICLLIKLVFVIIRGILRLLKNILKLLLGLRRPRIEVHYLEPIPVDPID